MKSEVPSHLTALVIGGLLGGVLMVSFLKAPLHLAETVEVQLEVCEQPLPRTEPCVLIAVPATKDDES